MWAWRDILSMVPQKQHFVRQQGRINRLEQPVVMHRIGQIDVDELGTNGTGQWFDAHTHSFR